MSNYSLGQEYGVDYLNLGGGEQVTLEWVKEEDWKKEYFDLSVSSVVCMEERRRFLTQDEQAKVWDFLAAQFPGKRIKVH